MLRGRMAPHPGVGRPLFALLVALALFGTACSSAGETIEPTATVAATLANSPTAGQPTATATAGDERPGWASFYLEATVRSRSIAETAGPGITPAGPEGFSLTEVEIAWSSESLQLFRQELTVQVEGQPDAVTQVIGTGDGIVVFDVSGNRYQRNAYPEGQEDLVAAPILAPIVLGPPSTPDFDAPFEGAVEMLEGLTGRPEGLVELREDVVAGRPTRVFETGPVTCETNSSSGDRECRGTVTVWVDTETGFILRYQAEDPGIQEISVEVTRIDYGVSFQGDTFGFDPPPGAIEATP